jgi:putative oxidoreductase
MNRARAEDLGKLLLRVTIGGLMLFHGVAKLSHGIERIAGRVTAKGLPGFVAFGVYVGEVVAPLLVIAGIGTRPAAVVIAFNMIVAVWLSSLADVWRLSPTGGWAIELQMLYLLGAVAIALIGAGRFSVSRGRGRWD